MFNVVGVMEYLDFRSTNVFYNSGFDYKNGIIRMCLDVVYLKGHIKHQRLEPKKPCNKIVLPISKRNLLFCLQLTYTNKFRPLCYQECVL